MNDINLYPDAGCCGCQIFHYGVGIRMVGIDQQPNARDGGNEFVQQAQLLCCQYRDEKVHTSRITPWPREAGDEPKRHGVISGAEDNRNGRGRCLCSECRRG